MSLHTIFYLLQANVTFQLGFMQLVHDLPVNGHFNWLPSTEEIPKKIGETVPDSHLTSINVSVRPT